MSILKREVTTNRLDEEAVYGLIRALPTWGRRLRQEPMLRGFVMRELQEMQPDTDRTAV